MTQETLTAEKAETVQDTELVEATVAPSTSRNPARRMQLFGVGLLGTAAVAIYSLTEVWWVENMTRRASAAYPSTGSGTTMVGWSNNVTGLQAGGSVVKAVAMVAVVSVIGAVLAFGVSHVRTFRVAPLLGCVGGIGLLVYQVLNLGSVIEQASRDQHATSLYRVSAWITTGHGLSVLKLAYTVEYFLLVGVIFQCIAVHRSLPKKDGEPSLLHLVQEVREVGGSIFGRKKEQETSAS